MSGIIRAPRPARGWTEIPDSTIRDKRLSYRARGVLVRLLSNAEGYRMTAEDLAREGREGRGAVLAALRELREAGYVVVKRIQGAGGRWRTESYVYDRPPLATEACAEVGFPDSGFPDSGFPDSNKNNQQDNQKQQQHTRARAHARARDAALPPAVSGGGAAAASEGKQEGKRRRARASGIVTWTPEDEREAAKIEAETPPEELAEAVEALKAEGKEPVPGLVVFELEQLRRQREAERLRLAREAERQARLSEPPAAPEAAARGRAILDSIRRRRHAEAAA